MFLEMQNFLYYMRFIHMRKQVAQVNNMAKQYKIKEAYREMRDRRPNM